MSSNWRSLGIAAAAVAVGAVVTVGLAGDTRALAQGSAPQDAVARGKYLVTIAGCNDCHTPLKMGPNGPEPDTSRMFSGHPETMVLPPPPPLPADSPWNILITGTLTAFSGPFGTSYARNITPDPETGLGKWTEEQFVRALRTGRHQGVPDGRMIMPPMPWPYIGQATDEDLRALWAYLRTVPAIKNEAPQSVPAAPAPPPTKP